jgi:hypothetical protein
MLTYHFGDHVMGNPRASLTTMQQQACRLMAFGIHYPKRQADTNCYLGVALGGATVMTV